LCLLRILFLVFCLCFRFLWFLVMLCCILLLLGFDIFDGVLFFIDVELIVMGVCF